MTTATLENGPEGQLKEWGDINWRWARRRHSNKSKKWVKDKYFRTIQKERKKEWQFFYKGKDRKGREIIHDLYDIQTVPIIRHVKVKGTNSKEDPELVEYWEKRQTKSGNKRWAKDSKYESIAITQDWKCLICHDHLFNGEETLHPSHSTCGRGWFRRREQPNAPAQSVSQAGTQQEIQASRV